MGLQLDMLLDRLCVLELLLGPLVLRERLVHVLLLRLQHVSHLLRRQRGPAQVALHLVQQRGGQKELIPRRVIGVVGEERPRHVLRGDHRGVPHHEVQVVQDPVQLPHRGPDLLARGVPDHHRAAALGVDPALHRDPVPENLWLVGLLPLALVAQGDHDQGGVAPAAHEAAERGPAAHLPGADAKAALQGLQGRALPTSIFA
mmetsp:Transcript_4512/g.15811  ORF Transcript_4512/g.15811 Transcript_4512/m.15811 type:complete len:202 (+) Transcript_4512:4690-5295(+)